MPDDIDPDEFDAEDYLSYEVPPIRVCMRCGQDYRSWCKTTPWCTSDTPVEPYLVHVAFQIKAIQPSEPEPRLCRNCIAEFISRAIEQLQAEDMNFGQYRSRREGRQARPLTR